MIRRRWRWRRQFGRLGAAEISAESHNFQSGAARGVGEGVREIALSVRLDAGASSLEDLVVRGPCTGEGPNYILLPIDSPGALWLSIFLSIFFFSLHLLSLLHLDFSLTFKQLLISRDWLLFLSIYYSFSINMLLIYYWFIIDLVVLKLFIDSNKNIANIHTFEQIYV